MSKKLSQVQAVLRTKGPLESQALAENLQSAGYASNPVTARKLIERARKSGEVKSSYPVRFDKSFLYYLEEHRGKRYALCVKNLLPQKPTFLRVFKTVLANKGWITFGQIGKASGCLPEGDNSGAGGRLTLGAVVQHLLTLGLIDEVAGHPGIFRIGKDFGAPSLSRAAFRKKIELETELLKGFRDWMRNCFLLAYDSHTIREDDSSIVGFNQNVCDVHGPVYFGPFSEATPISRSALSGRFLVGEILGYRQFTKNDAEATLERINGIGHRWKSLALCPITLAPSYSHTAWTQLRSAGVIALTFKDVFGPNIEELMKRFWRAISSEDGTPENLDEIEKSLELAKSTIVSDGFVGNLKGALFELLVALGFRAAGFDTTLQKIIRQLDEGKEYEVDVVATRGEAKCKLLECKGRHGGFEEDREDIERHFCNRCKAAADVYGWNVTDLYDEVEAIFITSGRLSSDAAAYVNMTKSSHGILCSVMDRSDLLAFLRTAGQTRLVQIIDMYY